MDPDYRMLALGAALPFAVAVATYLTLLAVRGITRAAGKIAVHAARTLDPGASDYQRQRVAPIVYGARHAWMLAAGDAALILVTGQDALKVREGRDRLAPKLPVFPLAPRWREGADPAADAEWKALTDAERARRTPEQIAAEAFARADAEEAAQIAAERAEARADDDHARWNRDADAAIVGLDDDREEAAR